MSAWQEVADVRGYFTGRGGLMGPDTSRRTHWWELTLACGHYAERTVRYGPHRDGYPRQRGGTQHRSSIDILPAPKRVLCHQCRVDR
jgi:hypothetical protein